MGSLYDSSDVDDIERPPCPHDISQRPKVCSIADTRERSYIKSMYLQIRLPHPAPFDKPAVHSMHPSITPEDVIARFSRAIVRFDEEVSPQVALERISVLASYE